MFVGSDIVFVLLLLHNKFALSVVIQTGEVEEVFKLDFPNRIDP